MYSNSDVTLSGKVVTFVYRRRIQMKIKLRVCTNPWWARGKKMVKKMQSVWLYENRDQQGQHHGIDCF